MLHATFEPRVACVRIPLKLKRLAPGSATAVSPVFPLHRSAKETTAGTGGVARVKSALARVP